MGTPDRIVVSPNNLNVYVAGSNFGNSVSAFDRDPDSGNIEQLPLLDGCISNDGTGGQCVDGRLLSHPEGIAISPDGRSVYVTGRNTDGIVVFDRNLSNGVLTQKAGAEGASRSSRPTTAVVRLGRATDQDASSGSLKSPVVSADNENVYVPATPPTRSRSSTATRAVDRRTGRSARSQAQPAASPRTVSTVWQVRAKTGAR